MFKKIRQMYWLKRDIGKGGNFVLLILVIIVAFISAVILGMQGVVSGYNAYENRKNDSNFKSDKTDKNASDIEAYEDAFTENDKAEGNVDTTFQGDYMPGIPEIDTSGMTTFLGYMSDGAYKTLIQLTKNKCKELGVNTAKKLDFQKIGATEFDVIGYILVGEDKVCECSYNLKSDVVTIVDTTYTESDIRDMAAAQRKAEEDELKKEQEEAKKEAEKEKSKKKGKKKSDKTEEVAE